MKRERCHLCVCGTNKKRGGDRHRQNHRQQTTLTKDVTMRIMHLRRVCISFRLRLSVLLSTTTKTRSRLETRNFTSWGQKDITTATTTLIHISSFPLSCVVWCIYCHPPFQPHHTHSPSQLSHIISIISSSRSHKCPYTRRSTTHRSLLHLFIFIPIYYHNNTRHKGHTHQQQNERAGWTATTSSPWSWPPRRGQAGRRPIGCCPVLI